jgi:two-component system, NtrC family, nitrogen regulation sensor histidine kinase NtrY
MRKRSLLILGAVCLFILLALLVWQGSFSFGAFGPAGPAQTFLFWAISTLIFLLTVTLGFMLFRTGVKLYLERQVNRAGSRIRTKLVVGAIALSFAPVVFLVLFGYGVMNRNLKIWFTRPAEGIKLELTDVSRAMYGEFHARVLAEARWVASLPQSRAVAAGASADTAFFSRLCGENAVGRLAITSAEHGPVVLCSEPVPPLSTPDFTARVPVGDSTEPDAAVLLTSRMPVDLAARQSEIDRHVSEYDAVSANKRQMQVAYLLYMALITLFVLFFSTWIARILAEQISGPISALLGAAAEVRRGNLAHRVRVQAVDELATLVRGFNEMVQALEANRDELERRRIFTEAILESIPTGVLSVSGDGRIQRVNRALRGIFPEGQLDRAARIEDLFPPDDVAEVRYLMKRAQRTGVAASQLEMRRQDKVLHLALTISALEERSSSGFVIILEDTSELLRAQKAVAWQEVARRIAHELKNPLTPIALSAERVARQIDKGITADTQRIIHECSRTILREVESVKQLVDEFSEFARFPAAQPVRADLNDIVRAAMNVFDGRLQGIHVQVALAAQLPAVCVDPEQMKRVLVNLVDNAAEAMQDSLVKNLLVVTHNGGDFAELVVADSGYGISPEDKERLFLPYFSTKGRGTGLGLAIVSRILAEHNASIRVERNKPVGARFVIEMPVISDAPDVPDPKPVETQA